MLSRIFDNEFYYLSLIYSLFLRKYNNITKKIVNLYNKKLTTCKIHLKIELLNFGILFRKKKVR
ncbi:hypothetical protein KL86DYS2_10019 [uncultured Dysgonomonas sp.]|uniref:Uncharacterized protein n=1 Tax=uncultured Dysgonomonas sp. TaxID=206096 RepID=A0A212ITN2_9BACT|nr:hypothetical protein KL86DYS2_10019 [uncultured Dysgonomonas sp.]